MKIGNVPSRKANFTLPPPHWVAPVSRRLKSCNKSSRRLLARVHVAVGSHPHMVWHAAGGQCLPWWGNPAGFKLLPHKHLFSAAACCDSARSHCEPGRRWALIINFMFFFSFYHRPRRLSRGWISFSGFLCRRMFKRREKKRGLAVFEVSTQSLPFGIFDGCATKC